MARQCEVCSKQKQNGYAVSHSHIRTKKLWQPNLQVVTVTKKGNKARHLLCTSCIKSNKQLQLA